MFMSTSPGIESSTRGWTSSDAFHAISQTNGLGPYVRQDYVYTNNGSHKGHNVSAAQLLDGSDVVVVSEIVPFTLYKSSSLDGPWTGCSPQSDVGASNISFIERHDGRFEITERNGGLAIARTRAQSGRGSGHRTWRYGAGTTTGPAPEPASTPSRAPHTNRPAASATSGHAPSSRAAGEPDAGVNPSPDLTS